MSADALPADPPYDLRRGIASASASLVCGLTQSLGWQLVNTNLNAIQGSLGASAEEITWLTSAYFAAFIPSVLLITKIRFHYGLRLLGNLGVGAFLAIAILHLFTNHLASAIAVRAAHGISAAALSTMAILYMIQAFPKRLIMTGVVLGFGTLQLGGPLSRVVATDLLEIGQWHGLFLIDVALPILCLAAVNFVELDPVPRQDALSRGDLISFPLWAAGIGLLCVFITQGRLHWWRDTPWLGVCLAGAIGCIGLFALVDLHRSRPLLNLDWLTSSFMLRFIAVVVLFRIVLSEQNGGVVGLLNVFGLNNDQMRGLFLLVLAGTVAGCFVALAVARRFPPPAVAMLAASLIAAAAWMDSQATALTRLPEVYFSQTLLALATTMFFSASVMVGFGRVAAEGMKNAVSFFAIFPAAQFLGSLAGSAWIATFIADRQAQNLAALAEHLSLADPQVAARLSQQAGSVAGVVTGPSERALEGVTLFAQQATREASVLAYNDLFQVIAAIAVGIALWFVVLLLRAAPAAPAK